MKNHRGRMMSGKWRLGGLALVLWFGATLSAFAQTAIQSIDSVQRAGA